MTLRELLYSGPPFEVLFREYAQKGRIDEQAPIQASDDVVIDASVEAVWQVLINLSEWPQFNPVFNDVRVESAVGVGAKVSFKLNGFPIKATIAVVDPARELTWVGVALWTRAIDRLVLEPLTPRVTRVRLHESLAGVLVPLMSSRARLHEQHRTSLTNIKRAVETKMRQR